MNALRIPKRFNGPLESGHGGYCSGVIAGFLDSATEVSLQRPVPLDKELAVVLADDGSVRVLDGDTVVADAHAATELDLELPAAVSVDEARRAAARYRGPSDGIFSRCFVCGRAREDALGVFAGAVEGRRVVASPWTPPRWTAGAAGSVLPEFVWAVLDCPTYFATYMGEEPAQAVLAQLAVRVFADVAAGEEHVVIAWPIETDRRKRHAGAAVLSSEGDVLAVARALMVEPRSR